MQVDYDASLQICGIAIAPWSRLGLERWFPNFRIASFWSWGESPPDDATPVFSLVKPDKPIPQLYKMNTQRLLENEQFQDLLDHDLAGYSLLTYKPVRPPSALSKRHFIMADTTFNDRYENKVTFRELLADTLPMPAYRIMHYYELRADEVYFKQLMSGRQRIVIQDEQLSGGKGTAIVKDYDTYRRTLDSLKPHQKQGRLVVSDWIGSAKERSMQCFVSANQLLTGPLQRQLVRRPELTTDSSQGDMFCGAVICDDEQEAATTEQATKLTCLIAERLRADGFRGIFGVDFLLTEEQVLYVIEVNPRITGVTPLLTALYQPGQIPFYLLHALELGEFEYQLSRTDDIVQPKAGSLLFLHHRSDNAAVIKTLPPSGTYQLVDGQLKFVTASVDLTQAATDHYVVQIQTQAGAKLKPNGRMASVLTKRVVIDKNTDMFYNETLQVINDLYQKFTYSA